MMIKELTQLRWYEKDKNPDDHRTIRKNLARFGKHGFSGMLERIKKDYIQIEDDYVTNSILNNRYRKLKTRLLFIVLFTTSIFYMIFIQSELYESKTALIVKDMQTNASSDSIGLSLLGVPSSSQLQDSMVVEAYLKSLDVYKIIDDKFNLTQYYKSNDLDFISRLSSNATEEEVLRFYNRHLIIKYDEPSGILSVSFLHVARKTSKEILEFLVRQVEKKINVFNRAKAIKQLKFVGTEYDKAKEKMDRSSQTLEAYQNKHLILDPNAEASTSSGMIAELETTLLQKKITYSTMSSYIKEDNYELKTLKKEIDEIKRSIAKERKALTGLSGDRLNKVLFEYEKLKMQLEFDIEVYKNALIQLETTKIDVIKEAKILNILSQPNLPDGYAFPNKPKMFITILFITLLVYGIFSMLSVIIRDHKE